MEEIKLFIANEKISILKEVLDINGCEYNIKESEQPEFKSLIITKYTPTNLIIAGIKFGEQHNNLIGRNEYIDSNGNIYVDQDPYGVSMDSTRKIRMK